MAYFITWTTYGTWLPGDERCWVDKHTAAIEETNLGRLFTREELWRVMW